MKRGAGVIGVRDHKLVRAASLDTSVAMSKALSPLPINSTRLPA